MSRGSCMWGITTNVVPSRCVTHSLSSVYILSSAIAHEDRSLSNSSSVEKDESVEIRDRKKQDVALSESVVSSDDLDGVILTGSERAAAELKVKRLLDMRLMPIMMVVFLMNYIDRVAVTSARLRGLEQDLHLSDIQYEAVLALIYASYCPAQIPSNMVLNLVKRPSLYIGTCVCLWGMTSALTGVTKSFAGIAACRVFIGLPEAAFYPGSLYLLSRWYTKKELSFRCALLYVGLLISNAFGSLIAAGILSNMEGALGIRAWRWLFYIEGAITICIGFIAMWALPDYPTNTRWMSPTLRRVAQIRLAEDAGEADEDSASESFAHGLKMALMDLKTWVFMLMEVTCLLGLSFVNFFPTLTQTLGYNTTITLLMAAPPWVYTALTCIVNSWNCDRTGERFWHISLWAWAVVAGYIIALSSQATAARYVALFLMASGYTGYALLGVWVSNSIPRPPAKRSVAIALANGTGNLGNLIGSFVWKAQWGPSYRKSMIIALVSTLIYIASTFWMRCILIAENKRLAREEAEGMDELEKERIADAAKLEGITFEEAMERKKGFRYLY